MASGLNLPSDCCSPCDDTVTTLVPGAQGDAGTNGEDGTNGTNAFTTVTTSFTVPAVNSNVVVQVANSSWMAAGQKLFVQNGGYYEFVSSSASTNATIKNLGYTGNAAPAAVVASANKISPGGIKGLDGSNGVDGDEPNLTITTKGDILTRTATDNSRLGIGTTGQIFTADAAQATGNKWAAVDLSGAATAITGAVPIANGGSGQITNTLAFNALSPLTTRGDMIRRGATNNDRFAIGAANTGLFSDGTDPGWRKVVQADILAGGPMPRYGLLGRLVGADMNITTDQAITILSGVTRYIIRRIVADNASVNLTTAAGGIYSNAGKAGTVIVAAAQVYTALTASTKFKDLTLEAIVGTDILTATTIYLSLTTAQGSAAVATFHIFGEDLTP